MMTGQGQFGAVEMGGMFTVLKVRRGQKPGDYSDPGWFRHPAGTVAREWTGEIAPAARSKAASAQSMPRATPAATVQVEVRKPAGHGGH
jgi:hypothetical protein